MARSFAFDTFSSVARGKSSSTCTSRGALKLARDFAHAAQDSRGHVQIRRILRKDERDGHLVEQGIGAADHRHFAHTGNPDDDALDLRNRDVLAADLQHVLCAVCEVEETIRVAQRAVCWTLQIPIASR